jgi:hypothetical protein
MNSAFAWQAHGIETVVHRANGWVTMMTAAAPVLGLIWLSLAQGINFASTLLVHQREHLH